MKNLKAIKTKDGKIKSNIINAINASLRGNTKLRPVVWKNNGRTFQDRSDAIKEALIAGGYKFKEGNDSSRGGREGDFIKVSKTALKFLMELTIKK